MPPKWNWWSAPKCADAACGELLKPLPLPEQDWIYLDHPVRRIVCGLDATPAALVVPDPRWFALYKRWLPTSPHATR